MAIKRRPSLLGALLWTGLGFLALLYTLGVVRDISSLVRFWPVLLILLGLGKILEYSLKKNSVSIRVGEIIGILLLLLIGTTITRISRSTMGRFLQELPFEVGGNPMRPGQWFGESHTYSEEATYPFDSAMPIRVENSYGTVSVTPGSDREIRVRLRKVIYGNEARAKSIASEIRLQGGPEYPGTTGATLKPEAEPGKDSGIKYFSIRTNRDSLSSRNYMFNTDLELFVPKSSQIQVVNSYGEVRASGIDGKLDLSAINRSLELRDCTGQFNISTRYAECRLTNLKGSLNVDGRGRVYIEDVKGDVSVANEYSPIEILNVDGKLSVSSTEGNLKIEKVTKPVVITARGTQVQVADLQDSLKITTSHRDVDISGVASQVTIESRYANLKLKDIKGNIDIDSSSDNINADDVGGQFILKARGSGIRANGVRGPLDIRTTLKDVVINDFGDSCNISNEYAGISISSQKLGKGDVNVKNRNGDIELYLPEAASFLIDATARNGKIESDYAGLEPTRNGNTGSLKSQVKSGGPKITVETDASDIHLYRSEGGPEKKPNRDKDDREVMSPSRMPDSVSRYSMALSRCRGFVE